MKREGFGVAGDGAEGLGERVTNGVADGFVDDTGAVWSISAMTPVLDGDGDFGLAVVGGNEFLLF